MSYLTFLYDSRWPFLYNFNFVCLTTCESNPILKLNLYYIGYLIILGLHANQPNYYYVAIDHRVYRLIKMTLYNVICTVHKYYVFTVNPCRLVYIKCINKRKNHNIEEPIQLCDVQSEAGSSGYEVVENHYIADKEVHYKTPRPPVPPKKKKLLNSPLIVTGELTEHRN